LPFAIFAIVKYGKSTSWLTTEAIVVKFESKVHPQTVGGVDVDIDFVYEDLIDDVKYKSDVISAYYFPNFPINLESIGPKLTVFVNPDDHSSAILRPGVWRTWLGMFFFPFLLVVVLLTNKYIYDSYLGLANRGQN
jgi:hypothetical protein